MAGFYGNFLDEASLRAALLAIESQHMACPIQIHSRAAWIGAIQNHEGKIRGTGIVLRGYKVSRSHLNFQPYLESIPLWLLRRGWRGSPVVPCIWGPWSLTNSWGVTSLCRVHHVWFLLDLDVEHLKRGGHFREAEYMRDRSYGSKPTYSHSCSCGITGR